MESYFREDVEEIIRMEALILVKGWQTYFVKKYIISLPSYHLSLFTIPKFVADKLEKIQRSFLWETSEEVYKYLLLAWNKVCSGIEIGGLGIVKIANFNQALLGKWLWRFGHEVNHLWCQVLQ